MKLKIKKDIIVCSNCLLFLDKEDVNCCESLALEKMFCKECMFVKVKKLRGFSTQELEKYLLLDNEKFKIKMDKIKKMLLEAFRKDSEYEKY
jgi:hypothetical protein